MDMNVDKQELCTCRIVREAKAEQSVDCDLTLPDYCCDIKSVLCCSVEPGISSVDITGNRITALGNAVIKLMYVGDDDKIACFEQNVPLSKYVEMSSLTADSTVLVKAKTSYVNCRAVSPRRVDVHACVTVLFSVVVCEKNEFVCDAGGEGIQLKTQNVTVCNAVGCTAKLFEMSEVVTIPEEKGRVKSVLYSAARPVITETKTVANKILIKGDLKICFSLCNDDGIVSKLEHSMPVSRIVELDGVDESCVCDVALDVSALDVQLKADESGEMKRLDVSACLCATVYGYREKVCPVVEDAYSLTHEPVIEKNSLVQPRIAATLNETFVLPADLDFSGSKVERVLDSYCCDLTCVCAAAGDKLEISGAVTVCVLYLDSEGKPCFAQRRVDYRHAKPVELDGAMLSCQPHIQVSGLALSGNGDTLHARVQFDVSGQVFSQHNRTVVSSISKGEKKSNGNAPAITVYFGDKGEKLWDIAKKYGATQDAVRTRNSLNGSTLNERTMLIIPRL